MASDGTELAATSSAALNHVGVLASPAAVAHFVARGAGDAEQVDAHAGLVSLLEVLAAPNFVCPGAEAGAVRPLVESLLGLLDAEGIQSAAVTAQARAIVELLGLAHPEGWDAAEAFVRDQLGRAR